MFPARPLRKNPRRERRRRGSTQRLQLLWREPAVLALGKVAEGYRSHANPVQGDEAQPHGSAGPAYYAVTTLVDGQVDGRGVVGAAEGGELRRVHLPVLKG